MATTVTLKPNAIDLSGSTSGTTTLQATAVAGTTTITLPAATDTLVGKATTDTLTNKTLTTPVISTISNTGTLTLPTSTDTLVGRATTDTLTNKTLTTPVISSLSSASATALTLQSAGTTAITVDTSQNVGIGTASPSYKLDVITSSNSNFIRTGVTGTNAGAGVIFQGASNTRNNWVIANQYNVSGALEFTQTTTAGGSTIGTTPSMLIDRDGNVGIGTTSPSYFVQANKNQNAETGFAMFNTNNSASASVGFYQKVYNASGYLNGQETQYLTYGGAYSGTPLSGGPSGAQAIIATGGYGAPIVFGRGGTFSGMWDTSGNLLVGTTSNIAANAKIFAQGNGVGIAVGYGTGNAQYRHMYMNSGDGSLYFFNPTNYANLSAAGAWTNASDARLKKNIVDIKYGLADVLKAQPRSYQMNDVGGDFVGFIAQELKEIIPEVVTGDPEKQLGVDYGSLVAVAFKAIQELKAINDTQAETINALTARIVALESK